MTRDWFIADSDLAREMRRLGYGALEIVRELVDMEDKRETTS